MRAAHSSASGGRSRCLSAENLQQSAGRAKLVVDFWLRATFGLHGARSVEMRPHRFVNHSANTNTQPWLTGHPSMPASLAGAFFVLSTNKFPLTHKLQLNRYFKSAGVGSFQEAWQTPPPPQSAREGGGFECVAGEFFLDWRVGGESQNSKKFDLR